jgi:acyl carrier protein
MDSGIVLDVEHALREIWSEVLCMPADEISSEDSFFSLGGDSVSAARIVNRINKRYRMNDSPGQVFETATIRDYSRRITARLDSGTRDDC